MRRFAVPALLCLCVLLCLAAVLGVRAFMDHQAQPDHAIVATRHLRRTPTPTQTRPVPTAHATATQTPAPATQVPSTATRVPPTATRVPPTATLVPPTSTRVPPTATSVPPTPTRIPAIVTPVLATATPAHAGIALGAFIHSDGSPTWADSSGGAIDWYAQLTGRMPAIVSFGTDLVHYADFAQWQQSTADAIRSRGAMPIYHMMTDDHSLGANQPAYANAAVVSGTYDPYFHAFAREAKAWGHPLVLRFDHEMNGDWYPWGTKAGNVLGNTPAQFIAAWRHVHDIFVAEGATNVRWFWCPNVGSASGIQADYPGDAYVDYAGLDGYNWATVNGHTWQTFDQVFQSSYAAITAITAKPLMLGEVASGDAGGDKAAWIANMFARLPAAYPQIIAVSWFQWNLEEDWRVNSSASPLSAYRTGVADPSFQGTLP